MEAQDIRLHSLKSGKTASKGPKMENYIGLFRLAHFPSHVCQCTPKGIIFHNLNALGADALLVFVEEAHLHQLHSTGRSFLRGPTVSGSQTRHEIQSHPSVSAQAHGRGGVECGA